MVARRQLSFPLFDAEPASTNDPKHRIATNHFHVKESTFLGGLAARVHRWFRLTPSFGPDLVQRALAEMGTAPCSVVLDPFAGAGTTLIEAKYEGHTTIGFEINPVLHFVCNTSTDWSLDVPTLRSDLSRVADSFASLSHELAGTPIDNIGIPLPRIHNPFRWWRPDVLKDLLVLREVVREHSTTSKVRHFFELALAGVLVPDLTNVTLGRLQLHFINRDHDVISVWPTFKAHVEVMLSDLSEVQQLAAVGESNVWLADSTMLPLNGSIPRVNRVVTSPPYPNRYSYVWNTRPHLYFLGFFEDARSASQLDQKTIGGTWGSATSVLAKGKIEPEYKVLAREIEPLCAAIRQSDNLMANYVMNYFNRLTRQIEAQHRLLAEAAELAYVIGCSTIKDVYIETDVLLGHIFEGLDLGYEVTKIERFRRRHSGKDLHESTVYVRRT